ncbi:MAG: sulfotransferase [Deltaproteobacteria bacterium]|nr:sulfotransferase [Deltaproteobacteria bacterium]
MERFPNFFIVGAAKSGTTSLYHYLNQHPEIYMSPLKEPKYFSSSVVRFPHSGPGDIEVDKRVIKTWNNYVELFSSVSGEKRIGEASPDNLYFYEHVAPLIKQTNPGAKIIIILRNPTERAFSAYTHLVKYGRETLSFEEALEIEEQRKKDNYEFIWFYKDVGFYYSQVKRYLNTFGEKNIRVYLYDDFIKNPSGLIRDIYEFLEVNANCFPDMSTKHNVSLIPKNRLLQNFLSEYDHTLKKVFRPLFLNTIGKENTEGLVNLFKNKNLKRESIMPKTKRYLIKLYRDDILGLKDLIKRDLSNWLE